MSWILKSLEKTGIAKQTPEQRSKIDAVIFALWAQGHKERSVVKSTIIIPISWVVGAIMTFISLPAAVARRIPEIIFAYILSELFYDTLEGPLLINQFSLFLLALLIVIRKSVMKMIRFAAFDIADFLTLGFLSKRYIRRHFSIGPLTVLDDRSGLKDYLFATRVLTGGPYSLEIEALLELVVKLQYDLKALDLLIDQYWRTFPSDRKFWRERMRSLSTVGA